MILINSLGVKVYSKDLNVKTGSNNQKIYVNALASGIYILMLEQDGQIDTQRIVIKK